MKEIQTNLELFILTMRMVGEIKAGGNVEEIVDKYVTFQTSELRQQAIESIRHIAGNYKLEEVR